MTELTVLFAFMRARYDMLVEQKNEDGYTIETVVIAAGLATLAIAVVGVIALKVRTRADQINLNPPNQ